MKKLMYVIGAALIILGILVLINAVMMWAEGKRYEEKNRNYPDTARCYSLSGCRILFGVYEAHSVYKLFASETRRDRVSGSRTAKALLRWSGFQQTYPGEVSQDQTADR